MTTKQFWMKIDQVSAMPGQLCHRLLVHTVMQQACHEVVTECMQMIAFGKTILIIDSPQPFCKGVRVKRFSLFIHKHIVAIEFFLLIIQCLEDFQSRRLYIDLS